MLELATLAMAVLVGALVSRWWLVPIPLVIAALWVAAAAAGGGADADGVPVWRWALFFGVLAATAAMIALSVGIILGRYVRDRRAERNPQLLPL